MKNLKELREAKGLARTELAYKLGVTEASVSNWESGRGVPHLGMMNRIADLLEVSLDQLVGREPAPSSHAS